MKTTKKELMRQQAILESLNDQLVTELSYVDQLMRMVGFSGGIETLKVTAKELIEMEEREEEKEF